MKIWPYWRTQRRSFVDIGRAAETTRLQLLLDHEIARREEAERALLRLRYEINFICGSLGLAHSPTEETNAEEAEGTAPAAGQAD